MNKVSSSVAAVALLIAGVQTAQPSAPAAVEAPLRDLPWSDQINFLHTTDTHGWHAGHLQEASFSADWGDYVSFAHHLRTRADADGSDLLVIDTGDKVEGNGLYDASEPKGNYTYPIFKGQDVDIITCGNHELYRQNASEDELLQVVQHYKDKYIASNIDVIDPETEKRVPLAQRFRKFTTKNKGIRVMAFGFIYDFKGASDHAFVKPVAEAVKEQWFQDAIRDRDVDLIVVAGHAPVRSLEYVAIFDEIRKQQWDVPVMFFGGHFHIRDYVKYDKQAYGLASGRYLETIGFQSISGLSLGGSNARAAEGGAHALAGPTFSRRYIDNNLFSFYHHANKTKKTFPTPRGKNISTAITAARTALGLDKRFGCAPQDYWLSRAPFPDGDGSGDSVFTWLKEDVLPEMVSNKDRDDKGRFILVNTGTIRFDVFKGAFTKDTTFIIQPFVNSFRYIKDVPFDTAEQVLTLLNKGGTILDHDNDAAAPKAWQLPPLMQIGYEQKLQSQKERIFRSDARTKSGPTHSEQFLAGARDGMQQVIAPGFEASADASLTPGYTTKDDAGDDGDDTVHSQLQFFRVPNVFEARVNTMKKDAYDEMIEEDEWMEDEEGAEDDEWAEDYEEGMEDGLFESGVGTDVEEWAEDEEWIEDDGDGGHVDVVDIVFIDFIQPFVIEKLRMLGANYSADDTENYVDGVDFTTMISTWITRHWNDTEC